MLTVLEVIGTLLAALVFLFSYWRYRHRKLPPGPYGLPIAGYLPWLNPKDPHLSLSKLAEKYGSIYSIQMGSIFTVVLSDVKLVRQAFATEAFCGRAPLYLTHGIMQGNGIICVQGNKWKEQRKFLIASMRNFGMVKFGSKRDKMEEDIQKGVDEMLKKIGQEQEIDTEKLLMHSLGNVVFNLVFGKTWSEEDETWRTLLSYQEEGTKLIGIAGPINFLPFLRILPKYKKMMDYILDGIKFTHEIYQTILREYRNSVEKSFEDIGKEEVEVECEHLLAAFDKEMKKRKDDPGYYTTEQFNYLMADMWGAGVDTTATTLRWFFLYMASHPSIQEKAQKEIASVVGKREVTLSDSASLPYFQACMSEVQRIRSVTPLGIPHGITEDTSLGGYEIPRGTMVVPLQWAIHMDTANFPEPENFNPSRFLDREGNYVKPDSFIPFQTGKRMCLGEEYAKMMLFLFGAKVLSKYTIRLQQGSLADLEGNVGITFTPKHHKLCFILRH